MSRIKGTIHNGSAKSVIREVYDELNGKVSEEDIEMIVSKFWGKDNFQKYLKGFESFSIRRLFFFVVYKNKLSNRIAHKKAIKKRNQKKYLKKLKKKKKGL